jgi:YabP family.
MFIHEIQQSARLENLELISPKITLYGRTAVSIEGHRGIFRFTPEEIVLKTKGALIKVVGDGFEIRELSSTELLVSGTIAGVEYVK